MRSTLPTWLFLASLAAGALLGLRQWREHPVQPRRDFLVFDRRGSLLPIFTDPKAAETETTAASLLQETLAAASGLPRGYFPIRSAENPPRGIRGLRFRLAPKPAGNPLAHPIGYRVGADGIELSATDPQDFVGAAGWFLERSVGARWFMPGLLGREVNRLRRLELPAGEWHSEPGYYSRNLGLGGSGSDNAEWHARNRLRPLFEHSHTVDWLITREDMIARPELRPLSNGEPLLPRKGSTAWQPNFTSAAVVEHLTQRLREQFRRDKDRLSIAIGQNDSWRWDQSEETLASVAPHRHFRHYPDYSNTLFAALNRVAERLAPEFPDRFITTYAYQWTENVPRFPVHLQVLPYLTADRSQWFDPAFKAEDQDILRRWGQAGPKFFGIYDYYYGSPFFVPRPTLHAVRESIPFAHGAGARAFYAECHPNWGLDGPKLWLAAQLLWDPQTDSDALLDEYFVRFWKEAAEPMRRFFALCDEAYVRQPLPGYWIKYFKDDHQRVIFPPEVRNALWAELARAADLARTPIVRERLALVRAAFEVSDLFCRHDEARDELSRLTHDPRTSSDTLRLAVTKFTTARARLVQALAKVEREHPLALSATLIPEYLRNDPRPRALRRLAEAGAAAATEDSFVQSVFAGRKPTSSELTAKGTELLQDRGFGTVKAKDIHPFIALDWNEPGGPWVGQSEPFETRKVQLSESGDQPAAGSAQLSALSAQLRSIRYSGVNQEGFYQTVPAEPGVLYRATVRVRGKVRPGNMTFLFLSFGGTDSKNLDSGFIDRLPVGEWNEWTALEMIVRAPAKAAYLGFGLRALYQVNDDFVEFAEPSLQRLSNFVPE
ncbi:MAG: hypothetical protein C0502_08345 [Opitutus sp.]|nr:hypothetical protein [Opitutus sp.]